MNEQQQTKVIAVIITVGGLLVAALVVYGWLIAPALGGG